MEKNVSLGVMEQPIMRKETLNQEELTLIKGIFAQITHLESKHLDTIKIVRERWKEYGSDERFLFHVQYPSLGGGTLNLVNSEFKGKLGESFKDILQSTRPEWISLHLGFGCEKLITGGQFGFERGDSEILEESVISERIIENIDYVRKNFFDGEILLENLDYMPLDLSKGSYEHVCNPEFIKMVLEETGCSMLLDIGHAAVSSKNYGYDDAMEYLNKLPLEKVIEIHMSGSGIEDGVARDSHHPINMKGQREIECLEELLKTGVLTNLKAVTLETFDDIGSQLQLLREILTNNGYSIT